MIALSHVALAVPWTIAVVMVLVAAWRARPHGTGAVLSRFATALVVLAAIATGAHLAVEGAVRAQRPMVLAHIASSLLAACALLALFRPREPERRRVWLASCALLALLTAGAAAVRVDTVRRPRPADVVANRALPPASMDGEGEGPGGAFFPSSS